MIALHNLVICCVPKVQCQVLLNCGQVKTYSECRTDGPSVWQDLRRSLIGFLGPQGPSLQETRPTKFGVITKVPTVT